MRAPLYLDYNATTPLDPRVLEAMRPFLETAFGNASSGHVHGRLARDAVEQARGQVAELLDVPPAGVVFTSGATESDNLAIFGVARASEREHLVAGRIEHKAVLDPLRALEREGASVTLVRPERDGRVSPEKLADALDDDTALVSCMLGNNEIGSVNPVAALAREAHERGALFHCDASQGLGHVPFPADDVDLVSVSSHKLYGPKGVGALYVRDGVDLEPVVHGGGHERGLRSGTLNVPAIVGFGAACALLTEEGAREADHLRALRDRLLDGLRARTERLHVHGSLEHRLPGNLSVAFDHVEATKLLERVDDELSISPGSACTTASLEPSHVLRGIGAGHDRAQASVRISVGRPTTAEQVDHAVEVLARAVTELRAASPAWRALTGS